jgi:CPA1 family monovalent cation:H+ antiporter
MLALYRFRTRRLRQRAGELDDGEADGDLDERSHAYQRMVREVLDAQRRRVVELRDEGAISDDVLHVLERELDLEDQRLEI